MPSPLPILASDGTLGVATGIAVRFLRIRLWDEGFLFALLKTSVALCLSKELHSESESLYAANCVLIYISNKYRYIIIKHKHDNKL